jgi:hypothetical protein
MEGIDIEVYKSVRKKVKEMKHFYINLTGYVVVIFTLFVINIITYPYYLWFLWPALGWGIAIALHGMSVFNATPFLGSGWEERKIRELVEKEKGKQWK